MIKLKSAALHFRVSIDNVDVQIQNIGFIIFFVLFKLNKTSKLIYSFKELKKMNLKISFL